MEGLRQYIISVVAAALLCSIVTALMPPGRTGQIMRMVCGLFLAYTVLHGVTGLNLQMPDWVDLTATDARQAAALGESLGEDAMAQVIKAQTEAYILDKAAASGLALEVEIALDESGVPRSVIISGQASPYERQQLQTTIARELGIAKENQRWTS